MSVSLVELLTRLRCLHTSFRHPFSATCFADHVRQNDNSAVSIRRTVHSAVTIRRTVEHVYVSTVLHTTGYIQYAIQYTSDKCRVGGLWHWTLINHPIPVLYYPLSASLHRVIIQWYRPIYIYNIYKYKRRLTYISIILVRKRFFMFKNLTKPIKTMTAGKRGGSNTEL